METSAEYPVLLLTGPRQVGKTTLLRHLAGKDRLYVSLDDPVALGEARDDPALFMLNFPDPLLIDEIQYAPQLLPYLKMAADNDGRPGRFWLTGSQQFHVMKGIRESLAGRVGILDLQGLSRWELIGRGRDRPFFLPEPGLFEKLETEPLAAKELYRLIWRGSLPKPSLNRRENLNRFMTSYARTYLERDVRDLAQVGDEMAFFKFLRACAVRTGQLLNIDDLSRDVDISPATGKQWLSILVNTGTLFLLEPWSTNLNKRMVKAPKLYFWDTGLAAWLGRWSSPEVLEAGAMSGAIFETWVVGELMKGWINNGWQPEFYFYRDEDQVEIDLLMVRDGVIHPLEIKKTASPGKNDVRHFQTLEKLKTPIGAGGVICLAPRCLRLTEKAWAIPLGGI
jgi:predicted AAA+ superfamily ATPase